MINKKSPFRPPYPSLLQRRYHMMHSKTPKEKIKYNRHRVCKYKDIPGIKTEYPSESTNFPGVIDVVKKKRFKLIQDVATVYHYVVEILRDKKREEDLKREYDGKLDYCFSSAFILLITADAFYESGIPKELLPCFDPYLYTRRDHVFHAFLFHSGGIGGYSYKVYKGNKKEDPQTEYGTIRIYSVDYKKLYKYRDRLAPLINKLLTYDNNEKRFIQQMVDSANAMYKWEQEKELKRQIRSLGAMRRETSYPDAPVDDIPDGMSVEEYLNKK